MKLGHDARTRADHLARLRAVPQFATLDDDELAVLDSCLTEVTVDAGKRLTVEGAVGREFVVIVEGLASVVREGVEVERLRANTFFGEHALLHQRRRTADVLALTPMRLLVAGAADFERIIRELPSLSAAILIEDAARQRGHHDDG